MVKNGVRICNVCRSELPDGAFCHERTVRPLAGRSLPAVPGIAEECILSPDGAFALHLCWECYLGVVTLPPVGDNRRRAASASRERLGEAAGDDLCACDYERDYHDG